VKDYFIYLPRTETPLTWGTAVTATGFTRIPPGSEYPRRTAHHPPDHMFNWNQGRVLDAWQLILVQEGTGWFESRPTGRCRVGAGTLLILFPGIWHRYAPDPKTGWIESWIELEGPVPDRLRQQNILRPRRAILHLGSQPDLTELLDRCHLLAQNRPMGYNAQLAAAALQILALVLSLAQTATGATRHIHDIVRRAQTLLTERWDQPLQIRELASELGVGYSHFRRTFRALTGLSPKQYMCNLRLRRVQTLLRNSSLTIKEIAERMGYHSPYHLSVEFKKRVGFSPNHWRHRAERHA
jgi:AraC-like DNA-binding protein